jgi:hypothetical protein
MDYESLLEKNVNHMMDKMFGDKDPTLKTITKMNLLYDFDENANNEVISFINKVKKLNDYEAKCIENELVLTYDKDGNIIFVNDIGTDECKNEIYDEPKGEQNTD